MKSVQRYAFGLCSFADAARTPHGDGNVIRQKGGPIHIIDAARTPHGDGNRHEIRNIRHTDR